jgi:hypothetical protein
MKSWNLPRSARRNQRGLRNRVPNGSGIFSLAFRDMFLIRNAPGGGGAVRNEHAAPRFSPQREGARYENRNRSCRSDLAAGGCIPCAKTDQVAAGAVAGDPAASSATPDSAPTTGMATRPSRSRSGTSTSGARDDNGDQGRDKMPREPSHRETAERAASSRTIDAATCQP